jgi:hypothetical protein
MRKLAVVLLVVLGLGLALTRPGDAAAACTVTPGYPEFFSISGTKFVIAKVYVRGCKNSSKIVDVCHGKYFGSNPPYVVLAAVSCAGYQGHPDGWIYSNGQRCSQLGKGLYVTLWVFDKTQNPLKVTNHSKFGC